MDARVAEMAGGERVSLRHGDLRLAMVHVPNAFKREREAWFNVLDAAERGVCPAGQGGRVEWDGDDAPWLVPRRERFVVVVCGRNVARGRVDRCLESLARQRGEDWGAVVIDDASDYAASAYLRERVEDGRLAGRVTLVRRRERMGGLRNLYFAVSRLCADPESVVVTLDLDDAFIGDEVFETLRRLYDAGVDLTAGGMLRTDKAARYEVNFVNPRGNRGGNVWAHLRSFRKALFDAVPVADLMPDGAFAELAADWAYMLPMAEMAQKPAALEVPLYLYDPQGPVDDETRAARERAIARIVGKRVLA